MSRKNRRDDCVTGCQSNYSGAQLNTDQAPAPKARRATCAHGPDSQLVAREVGDRRRVRPPVLLRAYRQGDPVAALQFGPPESRRRPRREACARRPQATPARATSSTARATDYAMRQHPSAQRAHRALPTATFAEIGDEHCGRCEPRWRMAPEPGLIVCCVRRGRRAEGPDAAHLQREAPARSDPALKTSDCRCDPSGFHT